MLPFRPILRAGANVELLIEMCADDHAARHHGPATLAAALRRFHELGGRPAPPGALAAADHAVTLRIRPLRGGAPPIRPLIRWVLTLAALAVAITPASLYVLPA